MPTLFGVVSVLPTPAHIACTPCSLPVAAAFPMCVPCARSRSACEER